MTPVDLALQRAEAIYAADGRGTCFDVEACLENNTVAVEGIVADERTRRGTVRELRGVPGVERVRDDLRALDDIAERTTIESAVASVRGDPDPDAEQTTQALYGGDVKAYDQRDGWRRIRAPDGYVGWIECRHLASERLDMDRRWTPDAVVTDPSVVLNDDRSGSDRIPDRIFAGTGCRIEAGDGDRTTISFRTGTEATVPADSIRRLSTAMPNAPVGTGEDVVEIARQFLGTPYEWGGVTIDGIDCSGIVRIAYECVGVQLPRDSGQQEQLGSDVERSDLRPGDLLFFPGHVAISLGGQTYIHAYGGTDDVRVNSLDHQDDRYIADLEDSLRSTKRLLDRP